MAKPSNERLYTAADFYMIRAPLLPSGTLAELAAARRAPEPPAGGGEPSSGGLVRQRAEGREALRALVGAPYVRQALHSASPSLSAALPALERGTLDPKRADRAYSTLLRYVTRMSTRPTPHGLLAGVAVGTFADRTSAVLADHPVRTTRTRADAGWLERLTSQIEDDVRVRDNLPVRVNSLLYRTGGRVILYRAHPDRELDHERVEITLTRPIESALSAAGRGPTFGDLVAELVELFPTVNEDRVRGLLNRLWELRILLSDLRPPLTEPVPELYVIKRLSSGGVQTPLLAGLQQMRRLAEEVDAGRGRTSMATIEQLSVHQRGMTPGYLDPTYQQDSALAAPAATLPREVAEVAAGAAELLMRLGCLEQRRPNIVAYHREFLERHGIGSELPLLEVLSPDTGLGPPDAYLVPRRQLPLYEFRDPPAGRRDRILADRVVRAARHRAPEVAIDDDLLEELVVWRPEEDPCRPRTSLDLFFQICASSQEALTGGDWRMVLSPIGYSGGMQGFGRFFDLVDEVAATRLQEFARSEERLQPEAIFAELSYRLIGGGGRGANIATHPAVRQYEICVNTAPTLPPDRQVPLDDILVGANASHFYLRSRRLGRRLIVGQSHALTPSQAPNVCRALLDFSADGYTPLSRFDWGTVSDAPFLPRLVRGRIVVHPAQWSLSEKDFPQIREPDDFYPAVQQWRQRWDVPRNVFLCQFDRRVLLDLDHPLWVDELYRELKRGHGPSHGQPVRLQEALPGPDELWLRDEHGRRYHSEVVVPLLLGEQHAKPDRSPVRAPVATATQRRMLPGSDWLYLKLYSAADLHDSILAGPWPELVNEVRNSGVVDRWFYLRYGDPLPHLRLRLHVPDSCHVAELLGRLVGWGRPLVEARMATDFAFTSYDREVERYGGGQAIDMLEAVFCVNSEVSANLVRLMHADQPGFDPEVLCVASIHSLYQSWGMSPHAIEQRASTAEVIDADRRRFREIRSVLCEVLSPGERRPDPAAAQCRSAVQAILGQQHPTVRAAGEHARLLAGQALLTSPEADIVGSLAHMQANRLLGVDRQRERRCHALWWLALRAIRGRPKARTARRSGQQPYDTGRQPPDARLLT